MFVLRTSVIGCKHDAAQRGVTLHSQPDTDFDIACRESVAVLILSCQSELEACASPRLVTSKTRMTSSKQATTHL